MLNIVFMAATEESISDLMAEFLRGKGIETRREISVPTPGTRAQPDFRLENGGTYLGEAKWEDSKWEGFGQARDYGQIAGMNGSFLIVYPKELKQEGAQSRLGGGPESILEGHSYSCAFLRRDEPTDIVQLELEEIPQWISANIERRREPDADPDEVVSVLRQTAVTLNDELEAAPEENLFRNVLGASPEDDEEEKQAARDTAGYLLVNQITFYRVLSAHKDFPEIDPEALGSPSDLGEYFELVLDYDYTPVYSFKIVDDLPQESLPVLKDAVKSIYGMSPENINHDVLGKVFHELIPISARKKVAAYYTKNNAADILAHLAIDRSDARAMDPACGSGTLLAAAYMRKRELSEHFTEEAHKRFVEEEITGIDVMPFAAHLSCIHLALQAPIYETDDVNIGIEDSTSLQPGRTISPLSFVLPEAQEQRGLEEWEDGESPDLDEEMIEGGSVAMDAVSGKEMELDYVDVVIMNPPYSRQESVARFADGYKDRLRDRFSRRDSKGQIHGKMSFCSYFMFLADKFLKEGGKIAAVLPASILNKTTDSGVRQMLLEEYNIQHIIARTDAPNFSEDTDMREILLVAEKRQDSEGASTAYTILNGLSKIDPADLLADTAELAEGEVKSSEERTRQYNSQGYVTRRFPTSELEEHNLFSPFAVENHELFELWYQIRDRDAFTRIDDLQDAWLTGGLGFSSTVPDHKPALINNPDANLRQNDVWILDELDEDHLIAEHRFIGEEVRIPREAVVPDFHRFSYRSKLDLSDLEEFAVLYDDFDGSDRFWELGETDGQHETWPRLAEKRLSHLGFMRRVDLTASGLCHLGYYSEPGRLYHGMMFCLPGLSEDDARRLSLWFDSSLNLLQMLVSRIPSRGGWTEYHRNTVAAFYVPDPLGFSNEDEGKLDSTFEEIGSVDFPSIVEQLMMNTSRDTLSDKEYAELKEAFPDKYDVLGEGFEARVKMDRSVLSVLGVPETRHDQILDLLYPELLKEITSLKKMMDG
jgi:hypothetical protein